jgi:triacylglycerol lipase
MQYDTSREALYHPESKPVFVGVDRMPRFQAHDLGFSLVNAWWLSNAAHLAYYDAAPLEHELHEVGLRCVDFFSGESTQAFLAASDDFAILAFRGTESDEWVDFKADADFRLASFQNGAKVHRGFLVALDQVWEKVDERLKEMAAQGLPTWYTGHSLGAALATLAAARTKPAALFSFGSPRVGNKEFVRLLDGVPVHRLVNCSDMAATVPPRSLGYRHVGELNFITSAGKLLVNPSSPRVFWSKIVGMCKYAAALPWFRRGVVKARSFADHAIVNYTSALGAAVARMPGPP